MLMFINFREMALSDFAHFLNGIVFAFVCLFVTIELGKVFIYSKCRFVIFIVCRYILYVYSLSF